MARFRAVGGWAFQAGQTLALSSGGPRVGGWLLRGFGFFEGGWVGRLDAWDFNCPHPAKERNPGAVRRRRRPRASQVRLSSALDKGARRGKVRKILTLVLRTVAPANSTHGRILQHTAHFCAELRRCHTTQPTVGSGCAKRHPASSRRAARAAPTTATPPSPAAPPLPKRLALAWRLLPLLRRSP